MEEIYDRTEGTYAGRYFRRGTEAEEAISRREMLDVPEAKEVMIWFGKGLVGDPFTSKSGKELVEVKIPNVDPADKRLWASFVISSKVIHDNKFGKGVRMKLPEEQITRVSKPFVVATGLDGQRRWDRNVRDVPNTELKAMMKAYKIRNWAGDRESVLGSLKEKKEEAALQPEKPKSYHVKSKGVEK